MIKRNPINKKAFRSISDRFENKEFRQASSTRTHQSLSPRVLLLSFAILTSKGFRKQTASSVTNWPFTSPVTFLTSLARNRLTATSFADGYHDSHLKINCFSKLNDSTWEICWRFDVEPSGVKHSFFYRHYFLSFWIESESDLLN